MSIGYKLLCAVLAELAVVDARAGQIMMMMMMIVICGFDVFLRLVIQFVVIFYFRFFRIIFSSSLSYPHTQSI